MPSAPHARTSHVANGRHANEEDSLKQAQAPSETAAPPAPTTADLQVSKSEEPSAPGPSNGGPRRSGRRTLDGSARSTPADASKTEQEADLSQNGHVRRASSIAVVDTGGPTDVRIPPNAFEHLMRNARRAATSSPLPAALVATGGEVRPSSQLATEILPAPPQLPHDPSYPPLDPLALSLAAGGLVQANPGQPGAIPAPLQQDKKRKQQQPVYSLARPTEYEGAVPYALYAIVNGLPEAGSKAKGTKRKRAKPAKEATNGRASRSGTPATAILGENPPATGNIDVAAMQRLHRSSSETLTETSVASTTATPLVSEAALPAADDTIGQEGFQSLAEPPARSRNTVEEAGAAIGEVVNGAKPHSNAQYDPASAATMLTSRSDLAGDADAQVSSPAPSVQDAPAGGELPSDLSHQSAMTPTRKARPAKSTPRDRSSKTKAKSLVLQNSLEGEAVSTMSRATTEHGPEVVTIASSSSSPAPTSELPAFDVATAQNDELALSSPGYRPTRAAAAKVAARGSYYDPSAYAAAQAPAQAATVYGLGARSVSGAPPPGARRGRKSGPNGLGPIANASPAGDVKGKGKESSEGAIAGTQISIDASNGGEGAAQLDAPANDEFCSTCFGVGHFICCDSCPRSFHFACVDPPLQINEVPLDDDQAWHCQSCSALREPARKVTTKADGIFAPLVQHVEATNPSVFSLPADIKNFFRNVATDNDGSYQDTSFVRQVKADKRGVVEQRDPYRLRDAKGKEILCYKCGESALPERQALAAPHPAKEEGMGRADAADVSSKRPLSGDSPASTGWRRIISCDFCSLHWHLDCLDPPWSGMPSNFRKWKCPCHIEKLLVQTRAPKSASQVQVIDLPMPSIQNIGLSPGQFYRPRVLNSGQIDIIPDPMDSYWSSATSADTSGRSLQRGWTNVDVPLADAQIAGGGMRKIRFRVPEKIIRTDWWMKVLSGGLDGLHDTDLTLSARLAEAAPCGLDVLARVAEQELSGKTAEQKAAVTSTTSVQNLVSLALNASMPPSVRLQPRGEHEASKEPASIGCLPNGGVLKKEENSDLPESSLRGTLQTLRKTELDSPRVLASSPAPLPAGKRGLREASSDESDLTDLDEQDSDPSDTKKRRTQSLGHEEIESLLAIRELMRRKGKAELLQFLEP
ncbi:unnamed protein product [Parajaminaea phylloscopi]